MTLEELQIAVAGQIADCMPEGGEQFFTFVPGDIEAGVWAVEKVLSFEGRIYFNHAGKTTIEHTLTFAWKPGEGIGIYMDDEIITIGWARLITLLYFDLVLGDALK